MPETNVPGITETLLHFHRSVADPQRRFLRNIAIGTRTSEALFDETVAMGANPIRAIRYPTKDQAPGFEHVWAGAHVDINLITALTRATACGPQVELDNVWTDTISPGAASSSTPV